MQAADRIVTAAEMTDIDRRAQETYGISGMLLMENAGQKAWMIVQSTLHDGVADRRRPRVAFVAGNGNNGGDALVMARQALIEDECDVLVVTMAGELRGAVLEQWGILERLGARRQAWSEDRDSVAATLQQVDWIIDGISGTGLSGELREPAAQLVGVINDSPARVVSVDVPSGLRDGRHAAEPAIRADLTIVTGYLKAMLFEEGNRGLVGDIHQVDPGFPPVLVNDTQVVRSRISRMPIPSGHPVTVRPDSHKGQRGRLVVVGGSAGTAGAVVLSAEGAGAVGVGMVRVLTGPDGVAAVLARNPSFMAEELPRDGGEEVRRDALDWADVAVLGPGWTTLTDTQLAGWLSLCDELGTAVILDAAALRVLAQRGEAWNRLQRGTMPAVLTPHIGEWRALSTMGDAEVGVRDSLQQFPYRAGVTVIVKSSVSWVRHGTGEIDVLDGRTPALAVAGSGDVLSGVLAGALARVSAAHCAPPEMIRDALRWGLARHLHAGRALDRRAPFPSAADIAAQIAADGGPEHE
jgi:NAD(P)H-hydrate epimerase